MNVPYMYVHIIWSQKIIPSSFNWSKDNSILTPGTASRKHSNFMPDPGIPLLFSADNSDYRGSGWSRGHMAPAGDNKFDQVNVLWYQLYLLGSIFIGSEYPVKVYQLESQQDSSSQSAALYPEAKHTEHSIFVEEFRNQLDSKRLVFFKTLY